MPILDLNGAKPIEGYKPAPVRGRRTFGSDMEPLRGTGSGTGGFSGAKYNRLTMDFIARSASADQDLFGDNIRLRARARELAVNNPHARKFLQMVKQNVVGQNGILMKSKITNQNGVETEALKKVNKRVEEEWKRWGKKGNCTADGKFSFAELQQMAIVNIAREGENLTKDVYGKQFNATGYALQPLDNDQLDDTLMLSKGNGVTVRMGVEVDKYRRPLAYHLWNGHPNDLFQDSRVRTRVDADAITHTAVWERPGQTRGYTWLSAAILPLNQYNGWDEATLVAARASAAKFATIEQEFAEGLFDEDQEGEDTNTDGTQLMTANAGEMTQLGPGQKLNFTDPRFPMNSHKEFSQSILRSIASGLLVSYPSLANDLEGVNFSSIRAGLLEERDCWRLIQRWFIDHFLEEIRLKWLKTALLTTLRDITLTDAQMEQVSWMARGWPWVDPQKDADSAILELGEGLTTYEIKCAEKGLDWQEVAIQRKKEQDFFSSIEVVYGVDITGDQGGKGVAAGDESEAAQVAGAKAGADSGNSSSSSGKGAKKGKGK